VVESLSSRLKWARRRARLTQEQIARASGMTQPAYSELESGKSKSTAMIASLASALAVSPLWLERGTGTPEPESIRETAPAYGRAVNESELATVIDAVETWLAESRRVMTPTDKAALVASLYRMLPVALEEADRIASRSTVVQLLGLVNRAGSNAQGSEGPAAFGDPVRKREGASGGRRAKGRTG
jgi:transcriptional regulator with XRE-family HTH domain